MTSALASSVFVIRSYRCVPSSCGWWLCRGNCFSRAPQCLLGDPQRHKDTWSGPTSVCTREWTGGGKAWSQTAGSRECDHKGLCHGDPTKPHSDHECTTHSHWSIDGNCEKQNFRIPEFLVAHTTKSKDQHILGYPMPLDLQNSCDSRQGTTLQREITNSSTKTNAEWPSNSPSRKWCYKSLSHEGKIKGMLINHRLKGIVHIWVIIYQK